VNRADSRDIRIRPAADAEADAAARLLHDFNTEFGEPTPDVAVLAERLRTLMAAGELTVLLAGDGPDGISIFRLRPALWSSASDAHVDELYVVPHKRGKGIGRALLEATMRAAREAGATRIDLETSVVDEVAVRLYESCGFTNLEGGADGALMIYFERDL
jgi:ribosomal protein S18 acetylase RimI-like enzyme